MIYPELPQGMSVSFNRMIGSCMTHMGYMFGPNSENCMIEAFYMCMLPDELPVFLNWMREVKKLAFPTLEWHVRRMEQEVLVTASQRGNRILREMREEDRAKMEEAISRMNISEC